MTALTKVKINEKQEKFLDNLISNGGNITKAVLMQDTVLTQQTG